MHNKERTKKVTKPSFNERCYKLLCRVPKGKVTSYGEIAKALGSRAYRAVGNAMKKNPYAPKVPCHRVVRTDGCLGGYAGGIAAKKRLLKKEGILIKSGKILNFAEHLHKF
ncbi:MAG: MGMT family protein [SAR324 cluster bacterium]|uniref:methylated-DNA--[protein]-cysteine S-methyltransferase n=1 Tax=SAR324 cluster bacterium TaxID=2024889 RepID=A0A7X9FUA5_9DELT|nr:MGMT family protein [SAR324 cluster bacterium]